MADSAGLPKHDWDIDRGYRTVGVCGDCGGPRYHLFDRATWSWSTRAVHKDLNCIQFLRQRIERLEKELEKRQ